MNKIDQIISFLKQAIYVFNVKDKDIFAETFSIFSLSKLYLAESKPALEPTFNLVLEV